MLTQKENLVEFTIEKKFKKKFLISLSFEKYPNFTKEKKTYAHGGRWASSRAHGHVSIT
jgi:hypothetical protein